jgi:predicted O-methyltransferase YrrM
VQTWTWKSAIATAASALLAASSGAEPRSPENGEYRFSADWTRPHRVDWVSGLAPFIGKPDVRGLEVGCFEGRSTLWFLEKIASHESSSVTCIDVFTPAIEERFDHNIRVSGLGHKVSKRKGYSQDVLRTLEPESFDFAYIDGCHLASCVLTDAVLIWDLLKPDGVLIFDDYLWDLDKPITERPKAAIDAFLIIFQHQLEVKKRATQVIVRKVADRSDETLVGEPVVHSPEWEDAYEEKRSAQERD